MEEGLGGGEKEKELLKGCKEGNISLVNDLLQFNPHINLNFGDPTYFNFTSLMYACENGHLEIVELLLLNSKRLNLNLQDGFGSTAFYCACWYEQVEIVRLMLKYENLDVNKPEKNSYTPLMIACENGHFEIVDLLLRDTRVDPSLEDNEGQTAFYIACGHGKIKVVALLLEIGNVNVNTPNSNYWTPLMVACYRGYLEIVQLILANQNGVNVNTKDRDGKTPIDISRSSLEYEDWENEEGFNRRKMNCSNIIALLESFEKNPNETRARLRIQLSLPG